MGTRYAVIDVGTNTVRLLVAEREDGRLVPAHTDKELVRLVFPRISCQCVEKVSDIIRDLLIARQKTEIGVYACGHRIVIARSQVHVPTNVFAFAADH